MQVKFSDLWNNHPAVNGVDLPCKQPDGTPNFENQCAIRIGFTLAASGVDLKPYSGVKCWFAGHKHHTLRAEEVANWLAKPQQLGAPVKFVRKPGETKEALGTRVGSGIAAKPGLVFLLNFWGEGMQGDHIDVWNGIQMAGGDTEWFGRCQQVWFWEVAN